HTNMVFKEFKIPNIVKRTRIPRLAAFKLMAPTVYFSKSFADIQGLYFPLYLLGKQKTAKPQHFVFTCPLSSARKYYCTAFCFLRQPKNLNFFKIFRAAFVVGSVKGQNNTEMAA
ncbi:MAG: hypothetical protein L0Y36_10220, partial [Planctomycetales bacterium]|nr:hypothetical protein [Planctomycetales bacterium]